jgi:hypothetical protein
MKCKDFLCERNKKKNINGCNLDDVLVAICPKRKAFNQHDKLIMRFEHNPCDSTMTAFLNQWHSEKQKANG